MKNCKQCNVLFEPKKGWQLFCSSECRNKWHWERIREGKGKEGNEKPLNNKENVGNPSLNPVHPDSPNPNVHIERDNL